MASHFSWIAAAQRQEEELAETGRLWDEDLDNTGTTADPPEEAAQSLQGGVIQDRPVPDGGTIGNGGTGVSGGEEEVVKGQTDAQTRNVQLNTDSPGSGLGVQEEPHSCLDLRNTAYSNLRIPEGRSLEQYLREIHPQKNYFVNVSFKKAESLDSARLKSHHAWNMQALKEVPISKFVYESADGRADIQRLRRLREGPLLEKGHYSARQNEEEKEAVMKVIWTSFCLENRYLIPETLKCDRTFARDPLEAHYVDSMDVFLRSAEPVTIENLPLLNDRLSERRWNAFSYRHSALIERELRLKHGVWVPQDGEDIKYFSIDGLKTEYPLKQDWEDEVTQPAALPVPFPLVMLYWHTEFNIQGANTDSRTAKLKLCAKLEYAVLFITTWFLECVLGGRHLVLDDKTISFLENSVGDVPLLRNIETRHIYYLMRQGVATDSRLFGQLRFAETRQELNEMRRWNLPPLPDTVYVKCFRGTGVLDLQSAPTDEFLSLKTRKKKTIEKHKLRSETRWRSPLDAILTDRDYDRVPRLRALMFARRWHQNGELTVQDILEMLMDVQAKSSRSYVQVERNRESIVQERNSLRDILNESIDGPHRGNRSPAIPALEYGEREAGYRTEENKYRGYEREVLQRYGNTGWRDSERLPTAHQSRNNWTETGNPYAGEGDYRQSSGYGGRSYGGDGSDPYNYYRTDNANRDIGRSRDPDGSNRPRRLYYEGERSGYNETFDPYRRREEREGLTYGSRDLYYSSGEGLRRYGNYSQENRYGRSAGENEQYRQSRYAGCNPAYRDNVYGHGSASNVQATLDREEHFRGQGSGGYGCGGNSAMYTVPYGRRDATYVLPPSGDPPALDGGNTTSNPVIIAKTAQPAQAERKGRKRKYSTLEVMHLAKFGKTVNSDGEIVKGTHGPGRNGEGTQVPPDSGKATEAKATEKENAETIVYPSTPEIDARPADQRSNPPTPKPSELS